MILGCDPNHQIQEFLSLHFVISGVSAVRVLSFNAAPFLLQSFGDPSGILCSIAAKITLNASKVLHFPLKFLLVC